MRVRDIMTHDVAWCEPTTTLERVGKRMREVDSGVLPVVEEGEPVGVVTDRDICLALAERNRRPSEVTVREIMSRSVDCCRDEDDVRNALTTMRAKRIRRLPVIDAQGKMAGILSMNDVILRAQETGNGQAIAYEDTIQTLQRICEHRYPLPAVEAADVTELIRSLPLGAGLP